MGSNNGGPMSDANPIKKYNPTLVVCYAIIISHYLGIIYLRVIIDRVALAKQGDYGIGSIRPSV